MSGDPFATETDDAPGTTTAGVFDRHFSLAALTATALVSLSVGGMLLAADTAVAAALNDLYFVPVVGPLLGVLVVGFFLSVGWWLGVRGLEDGSVLVGLFGAFVCVGVYAVFGGAILTPYPQSSYVPALAVTAVVSIAITVGVAAYVFSTDRDLSHWGSRAQYCFLGGLAAVVIGTAISGVGVTPIGLVLYLVGFLAFFAGFFCDLVYEIWMTTAHHRRPLANGVALFVAFGGIFVHVLQVVLDMLGVVEEVDLFDAI